MTSEELIFKIRQSIGEEEIKYDHFGIYQALQRNLNKLEKIKKSNVELIDFLYERRLQGISISRINKLIYYYFVFLNNFDIPNIEKKQIETIFFDIRNSKKTVYTKNTEWIAVRQILIRLNISLAYLKDWKLNLKNQSLTTRSDLITREDIDYIVKNGLISLERKVFFSILLPSGLRFGEVFTLTKDCFTYKKEEGVYIIKIKTSKTKLRRVIASINVEMITDLLDTDWNGWTFCYYSIRRSLKRYSKVLKKRLYSYLFRKSCISNLCEKKYPMPHLKQYVGWKTLKSLESYLFMSDKKCLNEAVKCGVLQKEA
jgi:integrase